MTKLRCRAQSSVSWTLSTAFHDRGLESRRPEKKGKGKERVVGKRRRGKAMRKSDGLGK